MSIENENLLVELYWKNFEQLSFESDSPYVTPPERLANLKVPGVSWGDTIYFWASSAVDELVKVHDPKVVELVVKTFKGAPLDIDGCHSFFMSGTFQDFWEYNSDENKRALLGLMANDEHFQTSFKLHEYSAP